MNFLLSINIRFISRKLRENVIGYQHQSGLDHHPQCSLHY